MIWDCIGSMGSEGCDICEEVGEYLMYIFGSTCIYL